MSEQIPDAKEGDLFRRHNGGVYRFICYATDESGVSVVVCRSETDGSVLVLTLARWEEVITDNAGTLSTPRFEPLP